ncbi:MAG: hypothetical protein ACR2M8_12545 [Pyrinomonadaceae bacterium]
MANTRKEVHARLSTQRKIPRDNALNVALDEALLGFDSGGRIEEGF